MPLAFYQGRVPQVPRSSVGSKFPPQKMGAPGPPPLGTWETTDLNRASDPGAVGSSFPHRIRMPQLPRSSVGSKFPPQNLGAPGPPPLGTWETTDLNRASDPGAVGSSFPHRIRMPQLPPVPLEANSPHRTWVPQVPRIWGPGRPQTSTGQVAHSSRYRRLCPVHRGLIAMSGSSAGCPERRVAHPLPNHKVGCPILESVFGFKGGWARTPTGVLFPVYNSPAGRPTLAPGPSPLGTWDGG